MKILFILFYIVIGFLYLYEWGAASNRCSAKWIMLTPFWIFTPDKFDEDGQKHLKRARLYLALALMGLIPMAILLNL